MLTSVMTWQVSQEELNESTLKYENGDSEIQYYMEGILLNEIIFLKMKKWLL